ncbi:MAG: ABC transporter ATP-binding protein [Spirochaetes bacterium]|nr:ABC transporter ATP-binding protein [Spirochaetota bacterium]
MLTLNTVNTYYGKFRALWDVTMQVNEKEIVALVGANGAGKTTLLNTISGLLQPESGTINFFSDRIDNIETNKIVEQGISQIPEGGKVFPEMTILENLEMGAYTKEHWKVKDETIEFVYSLFPKLRERKKQLARTLSGGERQMLAVGRGLMSRPKLCTFDEPSYGLSPKLVTEFFDIIVKLREMGTTVLLVEQNVQQTLEIADRAYVMENGRIVSEGKSSDMLKDDHIKKAYLGL